jgi:Ca2+-binding RTX toxin-like protein
MITRLTRAVSAAALLTVGLAAPAAAAVIDGTRGPDVLVGTAEADTIRGFGGADKIYGRAGSDRIYAGRDNKRDLLRGGPGNDRINARLGDTVHAGRGNDIVWVRPAAWKMAHIYCGPGYDRLYGYNSWLVSQRGCEEMPDD